MMDIRELKNRFEYHAPKDDEKRRAHETVRAVCLEAAIRIDDTLEDGREKSLAITKIEEAMFWANAGLARND